MAASSVVTIHRQNSAVTPDFSHAAQHAAITRRRRISPEAGRALEMLGHAIEYLTDEYIYAGGRFNLSDPQVQAAILLMEKNREIYFSCPELPTLGQRLRSLLHLRAA